MNHHNSSINEVVTNPEMYYVAKSATSVSQIISHLADTYFSRADAIEPVEAGLQYAMEIQNYTVVARLANTLKKLSKQ